MNTELLPQSIAVQFSGKPALYYYLVHPEDTIQPGWRVVVPTKMKDDGTVTLTIATCVERHILSHPDALKPIVMSITPESVAYATAEVARLEAVAPASVVAPA